MRRNAIPLPHERIVRRIDVDPESGCWLYRGTRNVGGYATYWSARKRGGRSFPRLAHRLMYRALRGEIPAGTELDHLCRVRHCVNPWHLEAVSGAVNKLRGIGKPALNARLEACERCGGPFEVKIRKGKEYRSCRACRLAYYSAFGKAKRKIAKGTTSSCPFCASSDQSHNVPECRARYVSELRDLMVFGKEKPCAL